MTKVLILGAGKIGVSIAQVLAESGDYQVTLGEGMPGTQVAGELGGVEHTVLDVTDGGALGQALGRVEVVISALPYFLNVGVAEAAKASGVHYFDLTEDVGVARRVLALAEGAGTVFIPQCGLAPGFISIVANHLVRSFDQPEDVRLRVGALPQYPDNALKYNLTWSTEGLINEYCNTCEAIHNGERREEL